MKNFQLWQDNEDISLIFLVPNTFNSHLSLLALSFFMVIYEYFKFAVDVEKSLNCFLSFMSLHGGFLGGSDGKEFACSVGDPGLIPGLGRSPGEENVYPLQYSCLENSTDRGAWWTTVHRVAKSQT